MRLVRRRPEHIVRYVDAMAASVRLTAKYKHYGPLYDSVIATLPPAPTVIEIGVANGGSLQTWRALLGEDARIIGIDLNPRAVALEEEGFEILILDTGDKATWAELRSRFRQGVDLLVDDGGHTNRQQISTILNGVDLVRDGGWVVVEDLHASFMRHFGNPHPYSAARFLNDLQSDLHRLHARSDVPPKHPRLAAHVEYMVSATSWVGLRISRRPADADAEITGGSDRTLMDYDHRWDSSFGRRIQRWVPANVMRLGRNRYWRFVSSFASRRLFKQDAGDG